MIKMTPTLETSQAKDPESLSAAETASTTHNDIPPGKVGRPLISREQIIALLIEFSQSLPPELPPQDEEHPILYMPDEVCEADLVEFDPLVSPSGEAEISVGTVDVPIEYATERWEVCHPACRVITDSPPSQDILQASLFDGQISVWLREGLGMTWAYVLAHMLWRAGTALDQTVCIGSISRMMGFTRSWVVQIVEGLCEYRIIRKVPGEMGRPRLFQFAKNEHLLRLLRQNQNVWRRKKDNGGEA